MIEYSHDNPNNHYCYFSSEGSYGDASNIVVVDVSGLDSHWADVVEALKDWQRPDFMRWYVDNQCHYQEETDDFPCAICEQWQWNSDLTEDEIIERLKEEEQ